jgi:hypothetical protein
VKKWLKKYLSTLFILLSLIGGLNLFMDPFWCYPIDHPFNNIQKGSNERQQKSNQLYFLSKQYDSLLIGSSRTTYMNRHDFEKMDVFNYAAPGMRPQEYRTFLNFAINDCEQPIQNIIIGMDFFGFLDYGAFMFNDAPGVVKNSKSSLYRYKILLSYDATLTSFKNLRDYMNSKIPPDRYNRDNVKSSFVRPVDSTNIDQRIYQDALRYAREEYSSHPNPEYNMIINQLKNQFRNQNFIIFTTPVSAPLFQQLIQTGHYENYENWLRSLVKTFGKVHHFMYLNSVANNYNRYFADCNHGYTDTYTLIAHKISEKENALIPKDFGMILTPQNVESKLAELRKINGIIQ